MLLILLFCGVAYLTLAESTNCPAGHGIDHSDREAGCRPCAEGTYRDVSNPFNWCESCSYGYTNGVGGATDRSSCTKCRPGFMRDAEWSDCVICLAGNYSETIDATSCTPCPDATTTRDDGATSCVDVSCSAGYGYDWFDEECQICDDGYSPDGQTPGCLLCPTGSSASTEGATSLEQCSVCWGGYEKVGDRCVACPVGTFRWPDNPETCETCPEGTTTTITVRWRCECLPGQAKRDRSDHRCYPCPIGRYTDPLYFTKYCYHCPTGTTTEAEGASSKTSCKCKKGYTRDAAAGDCIKCPRGTYSDIIGAASCTSCPDGYTTINDGTEDASDCLGGSCSPGQGYSLSSMLCEQCAGPTYSPDGETAECLYCPRGYKPKQAGATSVDQCTDCWAGWGREEDRCVECPIGTFRSFYHSEEVCTPCPDGTTTERVGSKGCICAAGYRWDWASDSCMPCPKGTYRMSSYGNAWCEPCPAGKTTSEEGQTSGDACVDM